MEEDKNSDFKSNNNTLENSNTRPGPSRPPHTTNSIPRPGPSNSNRPSTSNNHWQDRDNNSLENSNTRPGPSRPPPPTNSIPRPGPSNSNRPSTSNNHWQERDRDRNPDKKRSHSENNDWGRDCKLIKKETPDKITKDRNSENVVNERSNENSGNARRINIQEIAIESQRIAMATLSQPMTVAMPEQSQQQIMHQVMPYQPYNYNASENYHVDPIPGAYAVSPFPPMMPINSQWPVNNAMPTAASSIASTSGIGISNGIDMVPPANGNINAYSYINGDGSMYGMAPSMVSDARVYSPYPIMNNNSIVPMFNSLEPITFPRAVITPPAPDGQRKRRIKPQGCKTVYVGFLPPKITEDIIKDIFKMFGPIAKVRMNPKNFCHIRFENMESVDQAVLWSGCKIRIDGSEDPAYNSTLHVDYATARDDEHEYQCLERARLREQRHRQQEVFRPPSPISIPHFSEHESANVTKKLNKQDTMKEAIQVIITWLDRGECRKDTNSKFYSMIQSVYSHVVRLRNEKKACEDVAKKANEDLISKNRTIGRQIAEIEKVFIAAKTQKVWDQFKKKQRKKIEEMKNDTHDLKESNSIDLIDGRKEEEMDLSDTENSNDNEDLLQEDAGEELSILREKVDTLTEKLEDCKANNAEQHDEIVRLRLELEESKRQANVGNVSPLSFDDQLSVSDCATQCSPSRVDASENDNQLICLISIFLHVHPFGASIDYICSYLLKIVPSINARDVESLLRRFPNLFKEVCSGIGATLEKKWTYIGFRC